MTTRTKIARVAIRFRGVVYSLPPPNRHHDVIREIVSRTGVSSVDNDEQGFRWCPHDGRIWP